MYRAVGENSFRDGVFSHASPGQAYQASRGQFRDGSLGASNQSSFKDGSLGRKPLLPRLTRGQMSGLGNSSAFRDGSLGRAFRDGSLGEGTTVTIGPNGITAVPTAPVETPFYVKPAFLICAGLAGGFALYAVLKK